jgi:hypothetical protein
VRFDLFDIDLAALQSASNPTQMGFALRDIAEPMPAVPHRPSIHAVSKLYMGLASAKHCGSEAHLGFQD